MEGKSHGMPLAQAKQAFGLFLTRKACRSRGSETEIHSTQEQFLDGC